MSPRSAQQAAGKKLLLCQSHKRPEHRPAHVNFTLWQTELIGNCKKPCPFALTSLACYLGGD